MLKLADEIELYARGLAVAEGSVHCGGALRYHMSAPAQRILTEIAVGLGLSSEVRKQKQGSFKLTVSGKGWWKSSLDGLDDIHAFRGYIEGDGCWSHNYVGYRYKGKYEPRRYVYPRLVIFVAEREYRILPWIRNSLNGFKFFEQEVDTRLKLSKIIRINVSGTECDRLFEKLYENSRIDFQRGYYGKG